MYYGDGVAAEKLRNNSVCVKEGNMIRNIVSYDDLSKNLTVFVSNVPPAGSELKVIEPLQFVRYRKTHL